MLAQATPQQRSDSAGMSRNGLRLSKVGTLVCAVALILAGVAWIGVSPTKKNSVSNRLVKSALVDAGSVAEDIAYGKVAQIQKFPFMALFKALDDFNYRDMMSTHPKYITKVWSGCGATILSKTTALTAAHCIQSQGSLGYPLYLVAGTANIKYSEMAPTRQVIKVKQAIKFPGWSHSDLTKGDLGILILEHELQFNAFVQPAQLSQVSPPVGAKVQALGFGIDEKTSYTHLLKYKDLTVLPDSTCTHDSARGALNICVGPGICVHDSGSPLVWNGKVIGVASGVIGAAAPYTPAACKKSVETGARGVFMDLAVPQYRDWIMKTAGITPKGVTSVHVGAQGARSCMSVCKTKNLEAIMVGYYSLSTQYPTVLCTTNTNGGGSRIGNFLENWYGFCSSSEGGSSTQRPQPLSTNKNFDCMCATKNTVSLIDGTSEPCDTTCSQAGFRSLKVSTGPVCASDMWRISRGMQAGYQLANSNNCLVSGGSTFGYFEESTFKCVCVSA